MTKSNKMKINYLMIAAIATLMAGCSDEENTSDQPVAAQVNAEIGNVTTRASGTVWSATDEIGVSVVSVENNGATTGANVKYTKNGSEFTSNTPIRFLDTQAATFNAYYPFKGTSGTSAGVISVTMTAADQTTANLPKIDFMFASGATASKAASTVNFVKASDGSAGSSFLHRMSQLTIEFKAGTGVELAGKLTAYKIKSLNMSGTFNTVTGVAAANTASPSINDLSFTLSDVTNNDSYTAAPVILFPQSVNNNKFDIEVTVDGKNYQSSLDLPASTDSKFKSGYNLKYTVTVIDSNSVLTVSGAVITDWTTVTVTGNATMN